MAAASSSRFLATTAAAFTRFGSPLICWARINVSQSDSACQSRSVIAEEILFLAIGHHSVVSLGFDAALRANGRSEEHTSELQSLMRISYAVFCLKKKNKTKS